MRGNRAAGRERGNKGRQKERKRVEDGRRYNRQKTLVATCAVIFRNCRYDIELFFFSHLW